MNKYRGRSYCELTQDNWEEYKRHQGYAFIPEEGPEYPDKWQGPAIGEKRGVCLESQILSVARLLPTELRVNGQYHPTGCVADVATMPENRGKGNFKILFKGLLNEMIERGMYLAVLWPSSYLLYKKLGFRVVGTKTFYNTSFKDFQLDSIAEDVMGPINGKQSEACEGNGEFLPVEFGREQELLDETYRRANRDYNLSVKRTHDWWRAFVTEQSMLSSGKPGYVYAYWGMNGCEGYVIYDFDSTSICTSGEKATTMRIRELVFTHDRAYFELLKFIESHNLQADCVEFEGVPDSYFQTRFANPDRIGCQVYPGAMGRITDVSQALTNLNVRVEDANLTGFKRITIRVHDEFIEDNTGCYIIEIDNDSLSVKGPVDLPGQSEPDLTMSIGSLSQLYMGHIGIHTLIREPDVKIHITSENEKIAKLALLNSIFTVRPVFSLEYF